MTLISDTIRHPDVVSTKSKEDIAEYNALMTELGEDEERITVADRVLRRKARRAIHEYALNKDGIGYERQGYGLPGGEIAYTKLLEHLVISDVIASVDR